jgi:hypothetical protein
MPIITVPPPVPSYLPLLMEAGSMAVVIISAALIAVILAVAALLGRNRRPMT